MGVHCGAHDEGGSRGSAVGSNKQAARGFVDNIWAGSEASREFDFSLHCQAVHNMRLTRSTKMRSTLVYVCELVMRQLGSALVPASHYCAAI